MIRLEFDEKEMDYLFKTLAQRPWGEVYPLMSKIGQQVQEQQNARNKPDSGGPASSESGPG